MPNTSSWATFPAAKDPDRIHRYSDDEDDNFDFIEDGENRRQQEKKETTTRRKEIADKLNINYVDDDGEWLTSLGNYMKAVEQQGIVDGAKGLDEDYDVFINKYNKREDYDETKLDVDMDGLIGGTNISAREAYTLGLMQKARTDMKRLYHKFQIHRERIKNNAGNDDMKLIRMKKELGKEKEEEKILKKKMDIEIRIKEKEEEELKALYDEFPDEFRSLDISIFNIDDEFNKQLTDKTVLEWIELKTEKKKKGGRKRTRRKKRRRRIKSTKKKRRRKRKRTKKKRKRRRR